MKLNYKHTCPFIDDAIKNIHRTIELELYSLEQGEDFENARKLAYRSMIVDIDGEIESLRDLNSEMRDAADEQINSINEKLEESEMRISDMEEELQELRSEICKKANKIVELENKLSFSSTIIDLGINFK